MTKTAGVILAARSTQFFDPGFCPVELLPTRTPTTVDTSQPEVRLHLTQSDT